MTVHAFTSNSSAAFISSVTSRPSVAFNISFASDFSVTFTSSASFHISVALNFSMTFDGVVTIWRLLILLFVFWNV